MSTPPRAPIVGIDLGTTNSLVAVLVDGAPRLIPNALGEVLTPSVVSVGPDGEVLVGAAALARATTAPERTARSFKRAMGTDRAWDIGFGSVNAVQLSALVLSALKADAEAYLGVPVREAVITVPAYFGEHQRRATRAAAEIAGLEAERIINEPTAAALAYGLHARDVERRVVVIDLGGGTFDVTVLEIIEGIVEIQATAGDVQLGGDDFVEAIFAAVVADDGVAPATEEVAARLREACQRLVRALSTAEQATTTAPPLPGDAGARSLTFARETAEALWEPLLARIAAIIRRALRDGAVLPGAIAEVLLVGGASRMPCLARTAHAIFGKAPNAALPPDEAVALGAAVQAALKARDASVADLVVTDIAPFTMGIATSLRQGAAYVSGLYSPILQRGTTIPASRVERYLPIAPGQRRLFVEVFQGENALCQDNAALGKVDVALPRGTVEEQAIDVRFTYDLNGILDVEVTVVATGKTVSRAFHEARSDLTPGFVEEARRRMARLKVHPREHLPNRAALERANACYAELLGDPRDFVGVQIAAFLHALDRQEPDDITEARTRLNDVVDYFARGLTT